MKKENGIWDIPFECLTRIVLLSDYVLRIRQFANDVYPTNQDYYERVNNNSTKAKEVQKNIYGKGAEFAFYMSKETNEPDLNVYDVNQKDHSTDLITKTGKQLHVKHCPGNSKDECRSFCFNINDSNIINPLTNSYLAPAIAHNDIAFDLLPPIPMSYVVSNLKEPKDKSFTDMKAIYLPDVLNYYAKKNRK